MKRNINYFGKYGILFLVFFLHCVSLFAYDFEVDGICFNMLPNTSYEVEVTSKLDKKYGTNIYSGDISIPSEITYLGINYKVTSIGDVAFYGCGHNIKSVTLPNTIRTIGSQSFKSLWDIKSIVLPSSLITIGNQAFCDCQSLESIDIPGNVTSIGDEAFDYCLSLKSVTLGNSLKTINNSAFSRCGKLTSLNIPNSVEKIGQSAFADCKELKTVTLSQNLSEIGRSAFHQCESLNSIIIPKSVKSIGEYAFYNCYAADTIISRIEDPFEIPSYVFHSLGYNSQPIKHSVLLVPYGSKSKYQQYKGWYNNFVKIEEELSKYSFTIVSSGNGSVSYEGNNIRNDKYTFSVNGGETISITITPDDGYKIKRVKVNNTDVTSSVSNNQYTISKIGANTTVSIEFEAIPPTTYTLSITASGNGSASYDGTTIRGKTTSFTVNEGTNATITFTPDAGCRIASVKVNNETVSVTNNQYTVSNITANTTVAVTFEQIPPTYYDLTISATGNGSAMYNGTSVRGKSQTFSLVEGTNATITFTPDAGYRIASVKVNNATVSVSNNQYTVSNITANTTVAVTFEQIPPNYYDLTISATGNGSATYNSTNVRGKSQTFSVVEGTNATITFTPDAGYRIASVKVNNTTVSVSNNQYTVSNITANTTVAVTFEQIPPTYYDLTISATGNGSATYNSTNVRGKSQTFSVVEGTNATITFTPDAGYRIASVKVNNATVSVSNNQYTVSNITANTTVAVTFEQIPPTYYDLTISATGNGSATYNSTNVRGKTQTFSVVEGTNATITFTPDAGYRIASVKVNNSTVSVSNNQYTVSNITANTTVAVTFEQIPPTYYNLTISATGNGSATYNSTNVRGKSQTFSVVEGTNATIKFTPDAGYRIASVKVNNATVTVSNNQYTVSNITANTTVAVTFEQIPPTYYDLTISATGNGSATYNSTNVRGKSQTFSVVEGTNATISFSPDAGYRIASVKVNNAMVSVSNNQYTVSNITANTTVVVTFEQIPPTYYDLTISATGNGSATYNSTNVRGKTQTFSVVEGTNATITFTPDAGYRIKTLKVNNSTVSISGNQYTVSNISKNTMVAVEFEAIPITTYTLSITATGNGSASYNGTTVRGKTSSFTVNEGTNATITFTPDAGYRIASVKVNNSTVSVSNNQYTVSNITANTTVAVTFEQIPTTTYTLAITATGNGSASYNGTTVRTRTYRFYVNEGTNATITFSPDNGYRIKSLTVNGSNISVSNNQYTITNISQDMTVAVEFEAIPPTTYTLSVTATGNGSASFNGTTIRGKTTSFTVNEGTSATITFTPDNGYRIKSVKVNGSTVTVSNNQYTVSNISRNTYNSTTVRGKTSSFTVNEGTNATITFTPDNGYMIKSVKVNGSTVTVSNSQYTVNNISRNTTVAVEFEAIPITTYTLSVTATGNGYALYNKTSVRGITQTFTVNEGTNATITFTPDNGYRIKSVKVNNSTVTVSNNQYTVSNIRQNTTVAVEFEAIPPTTYTLSITATGSGSVSYNGTTVRARTTSFTVNEGTNATITFTPDNGYRIKSVKVNGSTVTVSNNQYTVSNISRNTNGYWQRLGIV